MLTQKEYAISCYDEYVRLQEYADYVWSAQEDLFSEFEAEEAQRKADIAFKKYEYAAGLRSFD